MNKKKRQEILETIEKVMKKATKTGVAGVIMLLLASIANAAIPVSDGFDYPVGWPDRTGYKHR